jgi:SHS family lactate transporter-like MFS transporter
MLPLASSLIVYYSIYALYATWLQTELKLIAAVVATPILLANLAGFGGMGFWGFVGDQIGRRWSIILPAALGCVVAPTHLLSNDVTWIVVGFVIQGLFGGAIYQFPSYLTERFPTEVRATASGFCYHLGAVFASFVPPVISYLAVEQHMGFAMPMLVGTVGGSVSVVIAVLFGPETKGKVFA